MATKAKIGISDIIFTEDIKSLILGHNVEFNNEENEYNIVGFVTEQGIQPYVIKYKNTIH